MIVGAVGILAATILAVWTFPRARATNLAMWRARTDARVEDKADQLELWLRERRGDAEVIAASPHTQALLNGTEQPGTASPIGTHAPPRTAGLLDSAVRAYGYEAIDLLDREGVVVAANSTAGPIGQTCRDLARAAAAANRMETSFHAGDHGHLILEIAVPIRDRAAGPGEGPVLGVVVLIVDPASWIAPMLRSNPASARDMAIRLVAVDHGRLEILRPAVSGGFEAPLNLSPEEGLDEGLRNAVAGSASVQRYRDAGGIDVVGATRPIDGMRWSLIATIPTDAALRDFRVWRLRTSAEAGLAFLAILGIAVAVGSRWQAQEAASRAERAALIDQANDAVMFLRPDGKILEANWRAEDLYGYSARELRHLHAADLRAPSTRAALAEQLALARSSGAVYRTVHVTKDGEEFPVEVSIRSAEQPTGPVLISIVRDISERVEAEERIGSLNRLLQTISEVNQVIVRAEQPQELLDETCRILVEHGGFAYAWIGFTQDGDGRIAPAAIARDTGIDPHVCPVPLQGESAEHTLAAAAVRLALPVVVDDWSATEEFSEIRPIAESVGLGSSAAYPILARTGVTAVLGVGRWRRHGFDEDTNRLLDGLTSDVGFALASMETEARFRAAFEEASAGVALLGLDGRYLKVNRALCNLLGYSAEELATMNFVDVTHPADVAESLERFHELLAGGVATVPQAKRYLRRDGEVVWAVFTGFLHRNPLGAPAYVVVHVQDLTELRRGEEALRQTRDRLQAVLDAAPVGIFSMARSGEVLSWNRGAERLFGWSASEVVGGPVPIIPEEHRQQASDFQARVLAGESVAATGLDRKRKDGSRVTVDLSAAPLWGADETVSGIMVVTLDVTERVHAEEKSRQTQKLEAIGRLAGGMAHDFNNVLQAMLGEVQLLRFGQNPGGEIAEAAANLEQQIKHASGLTRQLLLFSRREMTRLEPLDLNAVVRDTARLLGRLVRETVSIETALAEGPLLVDIDRGQIEQVLLNLAVNASDAMPEGGRFVIGTSRAHDGAVVLALTDTGQGMSRETREKIFEPFFTTKEEGKGTGLGLAVVHGIVVRHNATIDVQSAVGAGTTFTITFPGSHSRPRSASQETGAAGLAQGHGERLLVVEDEENARKAFVRLLERLGYAVVCAGTCAEAMGLPDQPAFDLILSDLVLPDCVGSDLAETLAGRWPGLQVILMSGYARDDQTRNTLRKSRVRFLQKPFGYAELARAVRETLDSRS